MTIYEQRKALDISNLTELKEFKAGDLVWLSTYYSYKKGAMVKILDDQDLTDVHASFLGKLVSPLCTDPTNNLESDVHFRRNDIGAVIRNGLTIVKKQPIMPKYTYEDMYTEMRVAVRKRLKACSDMKAAFDMLGILDSAYVHLNEGIFHEYVSDGMIELLTDLSVSFCDGKDYCILRLTVEKEDEEDKSFSLAEIWSDISNSRDMEFIAGYFKESFNDWVSEKWDYINRTGYALVYFDGDEENYRVIYDGDACNAIKWADGVVSKYMTQNHPNMTASLIRRDKMVAIKTYPSRYDG
jgi:hypothetical protein